MKQLPKIFAKLSTLALVMLVATNFSQAQSTSKTYVVTYSPRVAIANASSLPTATVANVNQVVQYFDGLGRPIQTVHTKGSPTQRDVVQPMAYDQYDRQSVDYLPYVDSATSSNSGTYKITAIASQTAFYANPTNATWNAPGVVSTPYPVSVTRFEQSPLSRTLEKGFPGDNWQLSGTSGATSPGHTVKIAYACNNATSLTTGTGYWLKNYSVSFNYVAGQYNYTNTLVDNGSYPVNTVYVTVSKNENWSSGQSDSTLNTTQTYIDKFGQTLLKRTFNYNTATSSREILSTYYVHDEYGRLTYVLPPGANPDAGGVTQAVLDNLCYQYLYDGRSRPIKKKIPGRGWDIIVYNKTNEIIATQDSVQRMKSPQQVSYIKYDSQGRAILAGYYTITGATGSNQLIALQASADAQTYLWETKNSAGAYSNLAIPTSGATLLITNYYDDYTIPSKPAKYTVTSGVTTMVRGIKTATITSVLTSPVDVLWNVQYYDDLGKPKISYIQHYLGGHSWYNAGNYDVFTDYFNFCNQIDTIVRSHFNKSSSTPRVTLTVAYDYDHVGRRLHTIQQIIGKNGVAQALNTMSLLDYNQIGQVYDKNLWLQSGSTYLNKVVSSYNERGWLISLIPSGGSFSERLYYNNPTGTAAKQFNGNIAQFDYNSPEMEVANGHAATDINSVAYTYDNLNRLTKSLSTIGKNDESVTYDLAGNIQSLTRTGTGPNTGTLVYNYNLSSNQLHTVSTVLKTYTYDGNGNATSDSTSKSLTYNMLNLPIVASTNGVTKSTYYYDAAGTKLRDISTNAGTFDYIGGIIYKNGNIDYILNDEGKVNLQSDSISYYYTYNAKDYLGNVRASYDNGGTGGAIRLVQENDYYPFGLPQTYYVLGEQNQYLYNGKEQQYDLYNQYDYGARFYNPVIARWTVVDPLAEQSRRYTPYSYGYDNPVKNIDIDGMWAVANINGQEGVTTSDLGEITEALDELKSTTPPDENDGGGPGPKNSKSSSTTIAKRDAIPSGPSARVKALKAIYAAAMITIIRAEVANLAYGYAAWAPGTNVTTYTTTSTTDNMFVRFYQEGVNNPADKWMMRYKDVEGLNIQQIRSKFGIKAKINRMVTVKVEKTTKIEEGEAATVKNGSETLNGGGTQYHIADDNLPSVVHDYGVINNDSAISEQLGSGPSWESYSNSTGPTRTSQGPDGTPNPRETPPESLGDDINIEPK